MRTRQERLSYILEKAENFEEAEKTLLNKLPMMILRNGLYNTLKYLGIEDESIEEEKKKQENKKDSEKNKIKINNYICEYIEEEFPNLVRKNKKMEYVISLSNESMEYMYVQKEILYLLDELVRLYKKSNIKLSNNKKKADKAEKEYRINMPYQLNEKNVTNFSLMLLKGKYIDKQLPLNLKSKKNSFGKANEGVVSPELFKKKREKIQTFYKSMDYEEHSSIIKNIDGFRTIIGLGDTSPREVSIHLNFLYGIPEIPSTAIKGVFSHYCMEQGIAKERLERWFGSQEQQGNIIFTTAYPEDYEIKEDVITNHFSSYYKEGNKTKYPKPEEPNVIKFYSVAFNEIMIIFYTNSKLKKERKEIETLWDNCLENCNFGAKGAVGYGYFRKI